MLAEAALGDADAAARRLAAAQDLPLLEPTPAVAALAAMLRARLPERAAADAVHVALAAVHGVDYLLTWNLRHTANAELRPAMEAACRAAGYTRAAGDRHAGRVDGRVAPCAT